MKLAIYTQIRENYGAHTWDGEGKCPQYWKFKGGTTYVIEDVSLDEMLETTANAAGLTGAHILVSRLREYLEEFNDHYEEYIIDWSLLDNDIPVGEDWDVPFIITCDDGTFSASRHTKRDEYWTEEYSSKDESYIMDYNNVRKDYKCVYNKAEIEA